jgi:LysM repeat protein
MRKLTFVFLLNAIVVFSIYATGDSLQYLTAKDTVFLKTDDYGSFFFEHTLEKGQTLFSLARFYGLKLDGLYAVNPNIDKETGIPPGYKVRVPIPDSAIVTTWDKSFYKKSFAPVFYSVKHGDTFYQVSKSFLHLPMDTLKRRNKLEKTVLFSGQLLQVGWLSVKGIPDSLQVTNLNPAELSMRQLQATFDALRSKKRPQFQNGAAYWQREKKGDNDFYALHREAPVGSVIEIKNPMRKKVVYAKVIAKIPDRAYGNDIVVVLSPSLARLLGAKDPKFFVEVRWF